MGRNCNKCGVWKSRDGFHKNPKGINGLQPRCKKCAAKDQNLRYHQRKEDPEWYAEKLLYHRLHTYKITRAEFDQLILDCDGRCSICRDDGKLVIDHDHTTGDVRALLCGHCNRMLGAAKDDPARLMAAAEFLNRRLR